MSITFHQTPDEYTSGFDPNIFVVSSNQTWQPNFRYWARIIDADGNTLREFRQAADPDFGNLYFDAHRTIENYLTYDISNLIAGTVGWQKGVNTFIEYKLNVTEEYGSTISAHVSGETTYIKAINSAQDFDKWESNSIFDDRVIFNTPALAQFLTNQPAAIPIRVDDSYELGLVTHVGSTVGVNRLRIRTYDSSGNLLKTGTVANPYTTFADTDERFLSILCGPKDLNLTTLTAGTQPLIEDNTAYYLIDVITQAGSIKTEEKRFNIDRTCTRSGSYDRLFWLNPLGRFDAFNFLAMKDDIQEVEQSRYSRLLGVKTSTSFTYSKSQVRSSVFFSEVRQSYKLRSGYINTEVAQWLKELVGSPRVYMIIDGDFIPVNIKTSSYQAKTVLQEKLFNVEIEVELSVPNQRQRL